MAVERLKRIRELLGGEFEFQRSHLLHKCVVIGLVTTAELVRHSAPSCKPATWLNADRRSDRLICGAMFTKTLVHIRCVFTRSRKEIVFSERASLRRFRFLIICIVLLFSLRLGASGNNTVGALLFGAVKHLLTSRFGI